MATQMTEPTEVTEAPPVEAAAEKPKEEIFKFSSWVHVGPGAEECEERFSGKCDEEDHFHAWIRLPNPFQIRDITEKAKAAKARRLRLLKDESSDPRVILESELDGLADVPRDLLVDEILDRDFPDDYVQAVRSVDDLDDPDWVFDAESEAEGQQAPKLYANIDQDREEYERQQQLPEDQRSEDYPELEKTLAAHSRAVEEAMKKHQEPRREGLMERDIEDLVDIIRRDRMDQQGTDAYLNTFNAWQWYVCTLKPAGDRKPTERKWKDINQMKYEEEGDVILRLKETFESLEIRLARSRQAKNS